MIIDSHQHFWEFDPVGNAWIEESMEIIQRDFLPLHLRPILQENKVDGCVAVQAGQTLSETEFLLCCASKNDFIKGVVGWVDLQSDKVMQQLEYYSGNKNFRRVRHIVQDEPDDYFMFRPNFLRGIGHLSKLGLIYDILVYPKQLPTAIELIGKFPEQKFVLDHIAKPQISKGLDSNWRSNIGVLASRPNVCCKLSGMITETDNFNWKKEKFTPFLDMVFQAFGANRLLFGSDWPVCLLAGTYRDVMSIVSDYLDQLPEIERQNIMGLNAINFYNL